MSNSQRELEDRLWSWINDNTPPDCTVIWARSNAPRPCEPYITLMFTEVSSKTGSDSMVHMQGDEFCVGGQRILSLSVICYGPSQKDQEAGKPGAFQILRDLRNSMEFPRVWEALQASGIAVHNEPIVNDISTLLETGFQDRSNMDIVFGFAQNRVIEIETIDTTKGDGSFKGTISHNVTIGNE